MALSAPSTPSAPPTAPPTAREGLLTLFAKSVVEASCSMVFPAVLLVATPVVGVVEVLYVVAVAELVEGVAAGHVGHVAGNGGERPVVRVGGVICVLCWHGKGLLHTTPAS